MSALPPKADIECGGRHVRFVPLTEICVQQTVTLFDHLVGAGEQAPKADPNSSRMLRTLPTGRILTLRKHLLIVELLQDRLEIPRSLAGQVI
jgi:hypothetical protein